MDKAESFRTEINFIKDAKLKEFAEIAVRTLPDYFFTMPSSTSGKYHPKFALEEGGLTRHVKACMRIAKELFRLEMFDYFPPKDKDIILVSLLLHDGYKMGDGTGGHTVTEHPIIASNAFKNDSRLDNLIDDLDRQLICDNIIFHMGQWTTDNKTKLEVLEKPKTKMQIFVHLVDYLASRKLIEINFEVGLSEG